MLLGQATSLTSSAILDPISGVAFDSATRVTRVPLEHESNSQYETLRSSNYIKGHFWGNLRQCKYPQNGGNFRQILMIIVME